MSGADHQDESRRPADVDADLASADLASAGMPQAAASWWTDLGITLRWRLAATGRTCTVQPDSCTA